MGRSTLPWPLGLDTDRLISLTDRLGTSWRQFLVPEGVGSGHPLLCSTTAFAEILTGRYRVDDPRSAMDDPGTLAALPALPRLGVVDIAVPVADQAARLGARHRLRLPDASNIVAAQLAGAAAFLTNDARLAAIDDAGIPIVHLDALIADREPAGR